MKASQSSAGHFIAAMDASKAADVERVKGLLLAQTIDRPLERREKGLQGDDCIQRAVRGATIPKRRLNLSQRFSQGVQRDVAKRSH